MSRTISLLSRTQLELIGLLCGLALQLIGLAWYRLTLRKLDPDRSRLACFGACFFLGSLAVLAAGISSRDIVLVVGQGFLGLFWFRLLKYELQRMG